MKRGNRQQRRLRQRQQMRKAQDMATHFADKVLAPQVFAKALRDAGHNANALQVSTDPAAPGHLITCDSCGKQARTQTEIPESFKLICPECVKKQ